MRSMRVLLVLALFPLAACHATRIESAAKPQESSHAPAPPPSPKAAPVATAAEAAAIAATVVGDLDRTVDPCTDFYRFACGGWLDRTEIPSDEAYWGRGFSEIEKRNEVVLREILDGAVKNPGSSADLAKLGAFYGSCMDEEGVERAGKEPLQPMMKTLEGVTDLDGLMRAAGKMHRDGAGPLFDLEVVADFKNPDVMIALVTQGGLGLFDRDYYLKDDEQTKKLREAYEQHIQKMFQNAGVKEANAREHAARALAFETELAKISRARAELRDPDKNYNKLDLVGLEKIAPGLPWKTFFTATGYPNLTQIAVGQPEYFEGLAKLAKKSSMDSLHSYMRWHLIHSSAALLNKAMVDENFAFYGAMLSGQQEIKPRWKRCVSATDEALGEILGKYYVEKMFPGDSKAIALDLIGRIEGSFREALPNLAWMDPTTRQRAVGKLEAVRNKIGYPDTWRDYAALHLEPGSYFTNVRAATEFEFKRQLDQVGGPVDRKEWGMTTPTVNAYYNPLLNEMVFSAGILQSPYFRREFPPSMNFGAIGMFMGHELTHGFDDQGRKFDPKGKLSEWWDPAASAKFEKQAACVEKLYSSYEPQEGVHINGKLTLGENIADLGGVKQAFRAYKAWEKEKGRTDTTAYGLTNEQLFFVAFAQGWCAKVTPELERLLVTIDSHSPSKYRVIGPVSNTPEFGDAFGCKVGSPMRPASTCTVW